MRTRYRVRIEVLLNALIDVWLALIGEATASYGTGAFRAVSPMQTGIPRQNTPRAPVYTVRAPLSIQWHAPGCQQSRQTVTMARYSGETMKGRILLAGVGVLAACTSVSEVNSRQDGHLMVTSRARWDIVSWSRVKNAGVDKARSYCQKHKKEMHAVSVHSEGVRGVSTQSVDVVFDCF